MNHGLALNPIKSGLLFPISWCSLVDWSHEGGDYDDLEDDTRPSFTFCYRRIISMPPF